MKSYGWTNTTGFTLWEKSLGNSSDSCWDVSVWNQRASSDRPLIIVIPGAALLKTAACPHRAENRHIWWPACMNTQLYHSLVSHAFPLAWYSFTLLLFLSDSIVCCIITFPDPSRYLPFPFYTFFFSPLFINSIRASAASTANNLIAMMWLESNGCCCHTFGAGSVSWTATRHLFRDMKVHFFKRLAARFICSQTRVRLNVMPGEGSRPVRRWFFFFLRQGPSCVCLFCAHLRLTSKPLTFHPPTCLNMDILHTCTHNLKWELCWFMCQSKMLFTKAHCPFSEFKHLIFMLFFWLPA